MESKVQLLERLNKVRHDLDHVVQNSSIYSYDHRIVKNCITLINLLEKSLHKKDNLSELDIKIIRGTQDLGMYSYKYFENTPLEDSIPKILGLLRKNIPNYDDFKPLGADFEKKLYRST